MPVYYTICPAPVPVVKGTVFNEILTLMRRFCTNKVEILTETAKKRRVPKKIRDAALSVSPDLLEFFAVLERAGDLLAVVLLLKNASAVHFCSTAPPFPLSFFLGV